MHGKKKFMSPWLIFSREFTHRRFIHMGLGIYDAKIKNFIFFSKCNTNAEKKICQIEN
jgi:hypothetical protein